MSFSLDGRTELEQVCRNRTNESNLLEYANENRHLGSFNDVEICTENDRFPANRMVLSCFSPFFEKMFKVEMKEKYQSSIEIKYVDRNSMKNLIEFIYTGKINISSKNVCDLISSSNYLQIDDVKKFCFDFLTEALSPKNCFVILEIVEHFENNSLKDQTVEIIARNFVAASTTIEFKNFNDNELRNCISKQDRSIVNEASVFTAILGWIKHDEENRATAFPELLKLVDLHNLPLKFFETVVLKENLVTQNHELTLLLFQAQNKVAKDLLQNDNNTRVLSLGGTRTLSKVIEVYNCSGKSPLTFPDLPDGRYGCCSVVMRGFLYCVGGLKVKNEDKVSTSSVWRMNLSEKELKWEDVKPMNKEQSMMGATVFEGNIFVVGDQELGEYYSSVSKSWQEISPLQQSRSGNALVACQDRLYVIGGFGSGEYLSSVKCLQIGEEKWKTVSPMQTPRRWLAAVCLGGLIYAIGGKAGESNDSRLKSVEKYDPSTDEWTYVSEMNCRRSACSACVLKGSIFVAGGKDKNNVVVKEIEYYDPAIDKWSIVGKTNEELFHHPLVAI